MQALHERTPLYAGSAAQVALLERLFARQLVQVIADLLAQRLQLAPFPAPTELPRDNEDEEEERPLGAACGSSAAGPADAEVRAAGPGGEGAAPAGAGAGAAGAAGAAPAEGRAEAPQAGGDAETALLAEHGVLPARLGHASRGGSPERAASPSADCESPASPAGAGAPGVLAGWVQVRIGGAPRPTAARRVVVPDDYAQFPDAVDAVAQAVPRPVLTSFDRF